jgi:hypothetical protein
MRKSYIYLILIGLAIMIFFSIGYLAYSKDPEMDKIYENSYRPDIPRSMQGIPFEDEEYLGKHSSPYALVKIPRNCEVGKEKVPYGHYLVKPFKENNVTYLIFKRANLTAALIPVEEEKDLPKKIKTMQAETFEDLHGRKLYIIVKHKLKSYTVGLNVVK